MHAGDAQIFIGAGVNLGVKKRLGRVRVIGLSGSNEKSKIVLQDIRTNCHFCSLALESVSYLFFVFRETKDAKFFLHIVTALYRASLKQTVYL